MGTVCSFVCVFYQMITDVRGCLQDEPRVLQVWNSKVFESPAGSEGQFDKKKPAFLDS